jgi:hypothetical protein
VPAEDYMGFELPQYIFIFFLFLVFGEGKSGQEMNRGREREST